MDGNFTFVDWIITLFFRLGQRISFIRFVKRQILYSEKEKYVCMYVLKISCSKQKEYEHKNEAWIPWCKIIYTMFDDFKTRINVWRMSQKVTLYLIRSRVSFWLFARAKPQTTRQIVNTVWELMKLSEWPYSGEGFECQPKTHHLTFEALRKKCLPTLSHDLQAVKNSILDKRKFTRKDKRTTFFPVLRFMIYKVNKLTNDSVKL